MDAFIKKYEFNFINRCLFDLNNAFRNCSDPNVIEATKAYIQNKIWNNFDNLTNEEKNILDISKITDPLHIDTYLVDLNEYVYGMPVVTSTQIIKLFKKEKKLKLPILDAEGSKKVYLGWFDEGSRKLFIAYNMDGKLMGMSCTIPSSTSKNTHICALCNHVGSEDEIAFVSVVCKTANPERGTYKSIGFDICLDSKGCNNRIESVEKLEKFLKDANNIK